MRHLAFRLLLVSASVLPAHQALADGGLPQLDSRTYPSQLFWLFVCFAVLYVAMSRISLPRVGETLERRKNQKGDSLEQASQWNDEAEKIKAEYEKFLAKAQKTAVSTVTTAERDISGRIAEEQAKFADNARKRMTAAEQSIAKARTDALSSLSDIASDIASDMVQKIADVQVSKADASKAVIIAMKEA